MKEVAVFQITERATEQFSKERYLYFQDHFLLPGGEGGGESNESTLPNSFRNKQTSNLESPEVVQICIYIHIEIVDILIHV